MVIERRLYVSALVLLMGLAALPLRAQTPPSPPPSSEAAALSQGWALLAQGDAARASSLGQSLLGRYPRSSAVLSFAVEAEVAHAGAAAGLGVYERWLGSGADEDREALRRVARGFLREAARNRTQPGPRAEAIDELTGDGDTEIAAEVEQGAAAGNLLDSGASAAAGNVQSVTALIASLNSPMGNKRLAMAGLAKSKSPAAVAPLSNVLTDGNPIWRAAAAEALGQLGIAAAAPSLKPLLDDPVLNVRFAAAAALFALKDPSGAAWLRKLETSDQAATRLAAARATKGEPDAEWVERVRALTKDADPDIRRQAAELLGPHDPGAARSVLEPLFRDANPAEREAASDSFLRYVATDFASLRKALHSADPLTRVRSAARILQLTR
jgi:hypothetical protein